MIELAFVLNDGRQIFLESFYESKTYAGVMEGKPSSFTNQLVLSQCRETAKTIWPNEPCVVLGIDYYLQHSELPFSSITCIAHFISYEAVEDADCAGSSLVVIWFQEEMFPLVQGVAGKQLKEVEWSQLARDFKW